MTVDLALALIAYAFVTSITPGPNNTMLLASGVNFGFRRTIPHTLGVAVGFDVVVIVVGLGVGTLFITYPPIHLALRYAGIAYTLYLAWKIARSGAMHGEAQAGQPMTFLQAAAFQWVNPKVWVMVMGVLTAYTPQQDFYWNVLIVALLFGLVNWPCVVSWAAFGTVLRRYFTNPNYVRVFNVGMALLLVASLVPLLFEGAV
ncbi:LysE family translocator [Methylovirgula sp. 4M-Z18]|uniref:LysE family translocator n=1 Tax=Methylovirgula sp. 4M-Z18 TaxID=2293567 RepID=UPI000E2FDF99|nr:LysE family translocator [Methylovirgula sp. 4M-Z18]RFB81165.1 LysE family translocator [Methylovirgula sp. 4M-Z18]